MKTIFAISILLIGIQSIAQVEINKEPITKPVQLEKRQVAVKKQIPIDKQILPNSKDFSLRPQFGDYQVSKYYILKSKVPAEHELNLIMGSLVKIQDKLISGNEIEPQTFQFTKNQQISRSDFIDTVFGREIRAPEPDIPEQLTVHRTDNEACYGVIQIDPETMAVPYKGVLLILKKI